MSPKSNNIKQSAKKRYAKEVLCFACKRKTGDEYATKNWDGEHICLNCYHDCCWENRKSRITALEARQTHDFLAEYRRCVLHYILGLRAYETLYSVGIAEAYDAFIAQEQIISEITYKKDRLCLLKPEQLTVMEKVLKDFKLPASFAGLSQKKDTTNSKDSLREFRRLYFAERRIKHKH